MIDREPIIKNPENGLKLDNFSGRIRLENVTFAYPKDPKKTILDNISIEFDINNTALVGESGCGKSTILQLIMRFYDPQQGRILFDGHDIRDLDLIWLRNIIGYVGQEPVLFATSIKENLLLGNENSTDQEIDEALKKAEAYDFVYEL
jgi:ATP-binding cassette, subfamily B (MDR/TAP), member 1